MIWIFSFSSYRDYLIRKTIQNQPKLILSEEYKNLFELISIGIFILGQIFVLSSFYKLGITGTFLGDYCGILMDAPITTFPFNILNNPMYIGSTLSFFALALYYISPVGILLTIEVYIVYQIALLFEEPYTKWIYEQKNK
jgi:methylene-fatty-acyl-phospholipid synthase